MTWQFIIIVCEPDDSYEMPRLIFSEENKIDKQNDLKTNK